MPKSSVDFEERVLSIRIATAGMAAPKLDSVSQNEDHSPRMNSLNTELALAPLGRAIQSIARCGCTGAISSRSFASLRRRCSSRPWARPLLTIAWRELTATPNELHMVLYVLILLGGILIIICGSLFSVIVMGGSTRTLVAHLLWNEPVTARATYRAVKSRFWGLLGASVMVALWLGFAAFLGTVAFYMVAAVVWLGAFAFASMLSGWVAGIIGGLGTVTAIVVALILFSFWRAAWPTYRRQCWLRAKRFSRRLVAAFLWPVATSAV